MLEKIKIFLYRIYKRSYGIDDLNKTIIIAAFVFSILSLFIFRTVFSLISDILLVIFLLRFFSSKKFKRGEENRKYRKLIKIITTKYEYRKTHKILVCECGQIIRVPKGQGKIEVTCPCCGKHIDTRS
ncbi:MAG: hypothetical protein Q4D13_07510 [Erysipelotrichaceae bacterium]|nr:hypothetical protein [Erysipelotrichaceae bacterium]